MKVGVLYVSMEGITASVEERAEYIADTHDVPLNAGYALQLAEIGFSNSGIAKHIGVTEGTVNKYQSQLEDALGDKAWHPVAGGKPRLDVFPNDTEEPEYAGDYVDYEPEFRDREKPLNRGTSLQDIPDELITIKR